VQNQFQNSLALAWRLMSAYKTLSLPLLTHQPTLSRRNISWWWLDKTVLGETPPARNQKDRHSCLRLGNQATFPKETIETPQRKSAGTSAARLWWEHQGGSAARTASALKRKT
jgi:hypothetical protein